MARDFIKINTLAAGATQAQSLKQFITALRTAYNMGAQIRAMMGHNHDNAIFTDIETLYGLPSGTGQTVYDLVNGSVGSMVGDFQSDDARQITEQVG